ncbi:DUF4429 domain-containing protein [Ethanoligenens sp.]|uniref:DUF4429 domain-containing protein n=1 Tax=Ethanoligenens sp. TaxID=2099655 RepID=UPI0039E850FD
MAEPILTLKGVAGQLELHENKVVIKRKGALAKMTHGFSGDKEIMIRNITGVQLKLGGFALNGFIQFTIPGGNESRKGISSATQDENTVMFHKDQNKIAQAIKEKIEEIQESQNRPQSASASSPSDEIRKLKGLLDDGIITQDEFDSKKNSLLSKI